MKNAFVVVTTLVAILLVGCGGSAGSVGSSVDSTTPSSTITGTATPSANDATVQNGLPAIPNIPN